MSKFQILAMDLDGTLLNSQAKVTDENLMAIKELNKRGIFCVPCSGRSLGEMPKLIVDNTDIRYIIHSNGSRVLDKLTGQTISASISRNTANKIFDTVANFQAHTTIRANGNCYIKANTDDDFNIKFYNLCDSHVDAISNAIKKEDFDEWKYGTEDIDIVAVFFHDDNERLKCKEILEKEEDLLLVSVAPYNIEIISKRAGKGNGLLQLAKMLNIDKKGIAVVGDSGNDLPMMKIANTRFVVSNASAQIKDFASHVICSNDEHAIEYILKNHTK